MTPEQAAWVRAHAWTERMRRAPWALPNGRTTYNAVEAAAMCDCLAGTCFHCGDGRHEFCHAKRPDLAPGMVGPEWWLCNVAVWIAGYPCRSLCPCPCPRTMIAREAEWVRVNVWTAAMRREHESVPQASSTCACQSGPSTWCQRGQHVRCHRATPLVADEAMVCDRSGVYPLHFAEPYRHESRTSATGPRRETVAMVWLADRRCRWVCPCDCHAGPARPRYEAVELPGLFTEVA